VQIGGTARCGAGVSDHARCLVLWPLVKSDGWVLWLLIAIIEVFSGLERQLANPGMRHQDEQAQPAFRAAVTPFILPSCASCPPSAGDNSSGRGAVCLSQGGS
jgi:hypothetical protein